MWPFLANPGEPSFIPWFHIVLTFLKIIRRIFSFVYKGLRIRHTKNGFVKPTRDDFHVFKPFEA